MTNLRRLLFLMTVLLGVGAVPTFAADTPNRVEAEPFLTYAELQTVLEAAPNGVAAVYTSSEGVSLPYRLYVPDGYDPQKRYPLVLFFHGAGERGTGNDHLFHGGSILQHLLTEEARRDYPCLILAPQCPEDSQWVLASWTPGIYRHERIEKSPYMTATEELLDRLIAEYAVDESALYVTGISMGGFATWDLISRYPDRFAAAIPVCGGIDPTYMDALKGFPIRTFHAKDDGTVSCVGTAKADKLLREHGDFLYTEYPDGGHLIWDRAYATPGLKDWLFAQKRVAETEPVTESVTIAEMTAAPESATVPAVPTDTAPAGGGCAASAIAVGALPLLTVGACALCRKPKEDV